MKIHRKYKI